MAPGQRAAKAQSPLGSSQWGWMSASEKQTLKDGRQGSGNLRPRPLEVSLFFRQCIALERMRADVEHRAESESLTVMMKRHLIVPHTQRGMSPCPRGWGLNLKLLARKHFFFFFLWAHLQHMEVLGLRTELELQLQSTPTAKTTLDLNLICNLHSSLRQCRVLHPLGKARDGTCILTETTTGP